MLRHSIAYFFRRTNGRSQCGDAAKRAPQDASHVHAEESLPAPGGARLAVDLQPVTAVSKRHDGRAAHARTVSPAAPRLSGGPAQLAASTGFAWAKKPRPDAAAAAKRSSSHCPRAGDSRGEGDAAPYEAEKQEMIKQWAQVAEAFGSSEAHSTRFRQTVDVKQLKTGKVRRSHLHKCAYLVSVTEILRYVA